MQTKSFTYEVGDASIELSQPTPEQIKEGILGIVNQKVRRKSESEIITFVFNAEDMGIKKQF